mmetsp:Transcript_26506/g.78725  ORF Transcript_26506/g.78725 Transcript_26506/m.78725 type:complete len:203 (-) Transcript_26506:1565-2173(-)
MAAVARVSGAAWQPRRHGAARIRGAAVAAAAVVVHRQGEGKDACGPARKEARRRRLRRQRVFCAACAWAVRGAGAGDRRGARRRRPQVCGGAEPALWRCVHRIGLSPGAAEQGLRDVQRVQPAARGRVAVAAADGGRGGVHDGIDARRRPGQRRVRRDDVWWHREHPQCHEGIPRLHAGCQRDPPPGDDHGGVGARGVRQGV